MKQEVSVVDESWLVVADAAKELGVSPQRVRGLVASGALSARKVGGSWLVDPLSVQRRTVAGRPAGRPLSPSNAWRVLRMLASVAGAADGAGPRHVEIPASVNAVDRSRLRSLLAELPDADGLAGRLSARAEIRRMRAHPAVIERLGSDERLSVGGGRAVAALGGGVAGGGILRLYVRADHLELVVGQFRLHDDVEGNVELAVIPGQVDGELLPVPGAPAPLAVAWVDLLDDADPRLRGAARDWVESLPRPLRVADGRRR